MAQNDSTFQLLTTPGILGFYNICEVTNIFLLHKNTKKAYNFFSIFCFEENPYANKTNSYLTDHLIPINKEYSLGISRNYLDLNESLEVYTRLSECTVHNQKHVDIGQGDLYCSTLEALPKQFVPRNCTIEPPLNKILKNNFRNGSYILEFFDKEKTWSNLSKQDTHKAAKKVMEYLPIDLTVLMDRIGNFIFQFPVDILSFDISGTESPNIIQTELVFDERIQNTDNFRLVAEYVYDNLVVGRTSKRITEITDGMLVLDSSNHLGCYAIYDELNDLILNRHETTWIAQMEFQMNIGSEFGNIRKFTTSDGILHQINVDEVNTFHVGKESKKSWNSHVEHRKYLCNLRDLEIRKEFLQYGTNGSHDREQALNDIRELLERGGKSPVYLWDPYLSSDDILDTWYYSTQFGRKLIAITSSAGCHSNLSDWLLQQKEILEKSGNNYGISIEFYCQHDMFGYSFHDRFLMIDGEKPLVWSLGTSVNSLGKTHHIIQQVSHAQHVIDNFLELKTQLERKECIIWNSNNQKIKTLSMF